jgi:D-apionolactonase
MRFNPTCTRSDAPPSPDSLPKQVDPRQMSLFGAAWTLGSIKYLGEGGAYSATYYETTGWLGVMEQEKPTMASEHFPVQTGEVFPLFHVLADAGEWTDAEIMRSTSSQPLSVEVLTPRNGGSFRFLFANFTDTMQTVELSGIQGVGVLYILDEHNVAQAVSDPDAFRSRPGEHLTLTHDGFHLELAPFAVARIDLSAHG